MSLKIRQSLFLIFQSLFLASIGVAVWSSPVPLYASPPPASSAKKAVGNGRKPRPAFSAVPLGRIVVKVQSGRDIPQDSADYSTQAGQVYDRKVTYLTKTVKVVNDKTTNAKTIVMPTLNQATFGFEINSVSPAKVGAPLSIPFTLTNHGTRTLYHLRCTTIVHSFSGGQSPLTREENVTNDPFIDREIFSPKASVRVNLDDAFYFGNSANSKPGATGDMEFIVRFSKTPRGVGEVRRYRFALSLRSDGAWDWVFLPSYPN